MQKTQNFVFFYVVFAKIKKNSLSNSSQQSKVLFMKSHQKNSHFISNQICRRHC